MPDPSPRPLRRPPWMVPGVLVLGMHRSGTSVVSGVLERLGLHGGLRETMLAPDEFNADGYWEQRPLVEWHDAVLERLDGWASAPPPAITPEAAVRAAQGLVPPTESLPGLFERPWFVKDPRQCLLLPLWTAWYGEADLAVLVIRHPDAVSQSLARRNGYSRLLATALWERYTHDAVATMGGRSCVLVRHDELVSDPVTVVGRIADAIAPILGTEPTPDELARAAALVRADPTARRPPADGPALWRELHGRTGTTGGPVLGGDPPPVAASAQQIIERRRRRLNWIRPLVGSTAARRAALDQIPGRLRRILRRADR